MKNTLRNTGNYVPVDAAYHSRRLESSSTRLWEPQILRFLSFSLKLMQQKSRVSGSSLNSSKPSVEVLLIVQSHLQIALSSLDVFRPKFFLYACGPKSCVLDIILISSPWFNWPGNIRWRIISTYLNFNTISLEFRSEESNESRAQWVPIFLNSMSSHFIILKFIS